MKERPILFSGSMVRAILEDRKTQTRRVVKPTMTAPRVAPLRMEPWLIDGEQETDDNGAPLWAGFHPDYPGEAKWFSCPYGQPGDRLWVRETWRVEARGMIGHLIDYRADPGSPTLVMTRADDAPRYVTPNMVWRPSIHMPRWASRLTLEITGVRVERLQDISWIDAVAEGMHDPHRAELRTHPTTGCVARFRGLWNEINAKRGYSWESNPFVWVVGFKKL
jgi:hypothetical protein